MLDPTPRGIMLLELTLPDADRAGFGVEQDGAGGGRALIDRQHMVGLPHAPSIRSAERARKGDGETPSEPRTDGTSAVDRGRHLRAAEIADVAAAVHRRR